MPISQSTRDKWKKDAIENQKAVRDMIHNIGMNYNHNPEQIAELLEFGSRFYKYSISNVELIYSQNKGATYLQSFEKWKEMDVSVMKGQKGLKIFVPVMSTSLILPEGKVIPLQDATAELKEMYKQGKIEGRKTLHFKVGNVFDISQTNFPAERYPELYSMGYSSAQHAAITDGLCEFCKEYNIPVSFEDISSIARRGFYDPINNRIVINKLLNDTQRLSTLSHELGYALEKHGTRDISAAQQEFEADSISILIQSHFGMELTDARKSHLAEHYRLFTDEINSNEPDMTEDELIKKVDDALQASLNVFRENIEKIQKYVEIHIEGVKMYYDPEYDREVDENIIKQQYDYFSQQNWFNKSYEQFRTENFMEISDNKGNQSKETVGVEALVVNVDDQNESISRPRIRHGR